MITKIYKISGLTIAVDNSGGGSLLETLKETCPENDFNCKDCHMNCNPTSTDRAEFRDYNLMMEGIESFLLSMACCGINLEDTRIINALKDTMEACANNS